MLKRKRKEDSVDKIKVATAFCRKSCYRIEEIILVLVLLLNVADFFEVLTPTLNYVKAIVSWTALGYILYKVSLTKIFFGTINRRVDAALIMTYFLLIINKVMSYAHLTYTELQEKAVEILTIQVLEQLPKQAVALTVITNQLGEVSSIFTYEVIREFLAQLSFNNPVVYLKIVDGIYEQFFAVTTISFSITNIGNYIDGALFFLIKFLVDNSIIIEKISFYAGCILLVILALYAARQIKTVSPSLLHILHDDHAIKTAKQYIKHSCIVFLVFVGFFIIVFNLVMEWLTVAVDAPLLMVGIALYFFLLIKHHKKFNIESTIYKLGSYGEGFYEKFISLFHTKNGLRLGISGMLVLHILTDLGMFLIPYTIYNHEAIYAVQDVEYFSEQHEPLVTILDFFTENKEGLLFYDLSKAQTFWQGINIITIYASNILAMIFLFVTPAVIWYHAFTRKSEHPHEYTVILFFTSLAVFLLFPLFTMTTLKTDILTGVDIQTKALANQLEGTKEFFLALILPISIVISLCFAYLYKQLHLKKSMYFCIAAISVLFFGIYIAYFLTDNIIYYTGFMSDLLAAQLYLPLVYAILFFTLTTMFYVMGFIFFIYEMITYVRISKK